MKTNEAELHEQGSDKAGLGILKRLLESYGLSFQEGPLYDDETTVVKNRYFWVIQSKGFASVEMALLDAAQVFVEGQRPIGLVKHSIQVEKLDKGAS